MAAKSDELAPGYAAALVSAFKGANPLLWPFAFFNDNMKENAEAVKENMETFRDYIEFLKVFEETQVEKPEPTWATKNHVIMDLHTLKLRDFSRREEGIYTLIIPPYAGHTSTIVDFNTKQSLIEMLLENGIGKVCSIDWKSATQEMKYCDIDTYLSELDICVDELGGRVNLAGMCWDAIRVERLVQLRLEVPAAVCAQPPEPGPNVLRRVSTLASADAAKSGLARLATVRWSSRRFERTPKRPRRK